MRRWSVLREHPLVLFFFLAYLIGWIGFLPLVLSRTGVGMLPINVPIEYIVAPTFAPTIAALGTQWLTQRNLRFASFYSSWKRLIIGVVVGPALMVIAFVIAPALLMSRSAASLHWGIFTSAGLVNWSTLFGGPIGEEPGWRGYALPRLQTSRSPFLGSVILACLWAGWHLPLFLLPNWTSAPFWVFLLILLAETILMTYGVNLSGQSVIVAVLMHASFNTCSKLFNGLIASASIRPDPSPALIFTLSPLLVALLIVACTRGRLGFRRTPFRSA
jgi:uncharacterized protein